MEFGKAERANKSDADKSQADNLKEAKQNKSLEEQLQEEIQNRKDKKFKKDLENLKDNKAFADALNESPEKNIETSLENIDKINDKYSDIQQDLGKLLIESEKIKENHKDGSDLSVEEQKEVERIEKAATRLLEITRELEEQRKEEEKALEASLKEQEQRELESQQQEQSPERKWKSSTPSAAARNYNSAMGKAGNSDVKEEPSKKQPSVDEKVSKYKKEKDTKKEQKTLKKEIRDSKSQIRKEKWEVKKAAMSLKTAEIKATEGKIRKAANYLQSDKAKLKRRSAKQVNLENAKKILDEKKSNLKSSIDKSESKREKFAKNTEGKETLSSQITKKIHAKQSKKNENSLSKLAESTKKHEEEYSKAKHNIDAKTAKSKLKVSSKELDKASRDLKKLDKKTPKNLLTRKSKKAAKKEAALGKLDAAQSKFSEAKKEYKEASQARIDDVGTGNNQDKKIAARENKLKNANKRDGVATVASAKASVDVSDYNLNKADKKIDKLEKTLVKQGKNQVQMESGSKLRKALGSLAEKRYEKKAKKLTAGIDKNLSRSDKAQKRTANSRLSEVNAKNKPSQQKLDKAKNTHKTQENKLHSVASRAENAMRSDVIKALQDKGLIGKYSKQVLKKANQVRANVEARSSSSLSTKSAPVRARGHQQNKSEGQSR